jgi:hypothetical protein
MAAVVSSGIASSAATEGLSSTEAQRRLREFGPNEIHREQATSPFVLLARQFESPVIWLLLGASVLSAARRHWSTAITTTTHCEPSQRRRLLTSTLAFCRHGSRIPAGSSSSRFPTFSTRLLARSTYFEVRCVTAASSLWSPRFVVGSRQKVR